MAGVCGRGRLASRTRKYCRTRMHSSRMRTDRLSGCLPCMHTSLPCHTCYPPRMPPCHACHPPCMSPSNACHPPRMPPCHSFYPPRMPPLPQMPLITHGPLPCMPPIMHVFLPCMPPTMHAPLWTEFLPHTLVKT